MIETIDTATRSLVELRERHTGLTAKLTALAGEIEAARADRRRSFVRSGRGPLRSGRHRD